MRSGVRAILIVGTVLLLSPGLASLAAPGVLQRSADATPPVDAWWVHWARDADGDRVDDAIERLERGAPGTYVSGVPRYAFRETPHGLRYDVFVRFAPDTVLDARAVSLVTQGPAYTFPLAESVYVRSISAEHIPLLLDLPGVVGIELERTVVPAMDIASPATLTTFSNESGNGARGRWKLAGIGSVFAVLDTGIDEEHESFDEQRFLGGYDATFPPLASLGISTPLNEVDPDDENGHGTHVAGIAFGADPNLTYTGMAPEAKFLDVRVMRDLPADQGSYGTTGLALGIGSTVLSGLEFVSAYNRGESYLGDPGDDKVNIVILSLSEGDPDPDGSSVLATAVNNLVLTGVHAVTPAGNCGPGSSFECCPPDPVADLLGAPCEGYRGNNTIAAPGSARLAITVAMADDRGTIGWTDDVMSNISSRGPNGGESKPNIAAFGVNITAPAGHPNGTAANGYVNRNGTSMATPMVAGALGLLLEADPLLSPENAKRILMRTARDVEEPGWDPVSGAGILNTFFAAGVALGFVDPDNPTGQTGTEDETLEPPTDDKPNITQGNRPPNVAFDFGPLPAQPKINLVFVDKSADPDRDQLVAWTWDFGDGDTGHGERAAHAYENPGVYKVRLTVTDIKGSAGSAKAEVTVLGDANAAREVPMPTWIAPVVLLVALLALARPRFGRPL